MDYPEGEMTRFAKVALFCTQAAAHRRPDMKQVVRMLSEDVNLNESLLSEPGLYRPQSSDKSRGSSSLQISSNSDRGKQSTTPLMSSTRLDSAQTITQMLPR